MQRVLVLFLVIVVTACSSVKTSYDIDKTVDFTKFKTYGFTEEAMKLPVDDLNRNRLLTAVDKEMEARGFSKSGSPDLWIDLQLKTQQMESATASTMGGYGYGRPYMYGSGFSTTTINVNRYVEGTLFINAVQNNSLVWQGRGTKTLNETASPEQRERGINYAVNLIFKKFPVQPTAAKK